MEAINPDRIMESDLLRWLLLFGETQPKFVERARLNLKPEQLNDLICRNIYQTYIEAYEKGASCDLLSLAAQVEHGESQQVISDLLLKKVNMEKAETQFAETIQQILNRNWMQEREAIKVKIHSGQYSDDDALALAKQFEELRKAIPLYKEC